MAFIDNLFRSRFVESIDKINAKLSAAHDRLNEHRALVPHLSFEVATDVEGAAERMAALNVSIRLAEDEITLLKTALKEAQRKEEERKSEARTVAHKSRVRALSQHVATLKRNAAEYEESIQAQAKLWRDMLKTADKIRKVLTHHEATIANALSPSRLTRLVEQELRRATFDGHPSTIKHLPPGVTKPTVWTVPPSLTEAVANLGDALIEAAANRPVDVQDEVEEAAV